MRRQRSSRCLAVAVISLLGGAAALLMPMAASGTQQSTVDRAATPRPNIILVLTDDQTFDTSRMPYLSSRADWIRFTQAFENVSLCCPSRSSILTGQYDTHTGVMNNVGPSDGQMLDETNTLPVWLKSAGYTTALVGKYLNGYPYQRTPYIPPGWDTWDAFLGAANYYKYTLLKGNTVVNYGSTAADYSTDVFTGLANQFIANTQQPFFLYYAPHTPHSPFVPSPAHLNALANVTVTHGADFNEADVSDKPAFIRAAPLLSPSLMNANRKKTWAMMLSVDDAMKQFDATLAAKGQLNNTIEIFMTDNGMAFGEHRWTKKRCEYDVCMRTPLLIRMPGHPAGQISRLVQNIDIASTIAELSGATTGRPQDGMSLVPLINGTATTWRDALLQHWGGGGPVQVGNPPNFWAIRTDRYRYVELMTGEKELYDYAVDPKELQNRAGDPTYAAVEQQLATHLAAMRTAAGGDGTGSNITSPTQAYQEEP